MPDEFKYDVFLSHSSHDRPVERAIQERLRNDGLHVWLDESEIRGQFGDRKPKEDAL